MSCQYYIKFKPEGDYWGLRGHTSAQSWERVVELVAERGIEKLEWVKHDRTADRKLRRMLNGPAMLKLWKDVVLRQRREKLPP
jgi:hypothetical protein